MNTAQAKLEVPDLTTEFRPLYVVNANGSIPMYSYDRPSYLLWQAFVQGYMEAGHTKKQAIDWLQSKGPRWALDDELGDAIKALGLALGRKQATASRAA